MVESFAEFHETLTLKLPKLGHSIDDLMESAEADAHGFIIEVAAIHEGLTANYNHYSAEELEAAIPSWVTPYAKPILLNHDVESCDPIGRVMAARMDKEADGTRYTRLQIAVRDPEAIQKISDQRYLTGSVGGKSEEALCSVCGSNWAEASVFNLPCKHARGKTYKGKMAYLERKGLTFGEYSFVNTPADSRSGVRPNTPEDASAEESGSWTAVARFFDLNMDKEEIMEYTESVKTDLLSDMRRKDALPLYLATKGAFLSALAVEDEDEQESSQVSNEEIVDDILSVTETLSDDLADAAVPEEPEVEEEVQDASEEEADETVEDEAVEDEAEEEENAEAEEITSEDESDEVETSEEVDTVDTDDEVADEEVVVAEEDGEEEASDEEEEATDEADELPGEPEEAAKTFRAQGQEKNRTKDVDPQARLGGASKTPKPDPKGDKTREGDASADGEGLEELSVFEARVKELEEENAKLRTALHRTLAERVVDTKIALGLIEVSDREVELEEHAVRSASSLADSMRDLSKMSFNRTSTGAVPSVESGARAVDDDRTHTIDADEVEEEEELDPLTEAEKVFVDTLMGRRKL